MSLNNLHGDNLYVQLESILHKLATPVLDNLIKFELHRAIPSFFSTGKEQYFQHTLALESFGRLYCGISSYLESGINLSTNMSSKVIEIIELNARNSGYLKWTGYEQPLVDASYFAYGLLNNPSVFNGLSTDARKYISNSLVESLNIKPFDNNWLLMPLIINCCLDNYFSMGVFDNFSNTIKKIESWYVGDGFYKDGSYFALDYYNSYVFHPYLIMLSNFNNERKTNLIFNRENVLARAIRYSDILSILFNKDSGFPMTGRSIVYRSGITFILVELLLYDLKENILSLEKRQLYFDIIIDVIKLFFIKNSPFNSSNFLEPGYLHANCNLADDYITSASLYMCTLAFGVLSIPPNSDLWNNYGTSSLREVCSDLSLERKNGYSSTRIFL